MHENIYEQKKVHAQSRNVMLSQVAHEKSLSETHSPLDLQSAHIALAALDSLTIFKICKRKFKSRLLFSSAEMFKKPLWQTV